MSKLERIGDLLAETEHPHVGKVSYDVYWLPERSHPVLLQIMTGAADCSPTLTPDAARKLAGLLTAAADAADRPAEPALAEPGEASA